jgi:hypothetical protein
MDYELLYFQQPCPCVMLNWPGLGSDIMACKTDDDRAAVADYISDLAAELASMAAWARHTDLVRLLEMARVESERLCGRHREGAAPPHDAVAGFEPTNVVILAAVRGAQK